MPRRKLLRASEQDWRGNEIILIAGPRKLGGWAFFVTLIGETPFKSPLTYLFVSASSKCLHNAYSYMSLQTAQSPCQVAKCRVICPLYLTHYDLQAHRAALTGPAQEEIPEVFIVYGNNSESDLTSGQQYFQHRYFLHIEVFLLSNRLIQPRRQR